MRRMTYVIKNRFDGDTCIIPHHYSRRDIRIERWNFTRSHAGYVEICIHLLAADCYELRNIFGSALSNLRSAYVTCHIVVCAIYATYLQFAKLNPRQD